MTPDELAAIASLQKSIDAVNSSVAKLATEVIAHRSELTALGSKAKRHSGFITATNTRASQAGDDVTDLKAAVITTVANLEKSIGEVRSQVAGVARATQGQNVELAVQTSTLNEQTTTLDKFRRTPRMAAVASFVGAMLWEILSHYLRTH